MATQQPTTKGSAWRHSSKALNDRLCEILPRDDDEDGYLLFANTETNAPVVSTTLGAVLKAQRESVELSQQAAAYRASINPACLRTVEKGSRQPTISMFLAICEAIGADPRELFNRALTHMGYPLGFVPVRNNQP